MHAAATGSLCACAGAKRARACREKIAVHTQRHAPCKPSAVLSCVHAVCALVASKSQAPPDAARLCPCACSRAFACHAHRCTSCSMDMHAYVLARASVLCMLVLCLGRPCMLCACVLVYARCLRHLHSLTTLPPPPSTAHLLGSCSTHAPHSTRPTFG